MSKETFRQSLAELLGTFVLIVFGVAVVAQVVLSKSTAGEYLSINFGWALAVVMGVYCSAGVSGAHLNPAVTIAMAVHGKFAWSKVVPYILAQMIGAFLASGVVFVTYHEALDAYTNGVLEVPGIERSATAVTMNAEGEITSGGKVKFDATARNPTAQIWATYPQKFPDGTYLSTFPGGLIDQIVGTALLLLIIFAVGDLKNLAPQSNLGPLVVGAVVLLIGMTFGYNCGYAINPARDLGPRLFTYFAGWGEAVFTANDHWWWVPIVGPCIGGVIGGYLYQVLIARRHPPNDAAPSGQ